MSSEWTVADTLVAPAPDDFVSFSVVAEPGPGVSMGEIRERLTVDTVHEYKASRSTLAQVAEQLRSLGFEVFTLPSPVVSARGTVARFESVFGARLVKKIRTVTRNDSTRTISAIVLAPGSAPPSPTRIAGALLIAVVEPPLFVSPSIPPGTEPFSLHLPGDLAQLTGASATHRLTTAQGESATGSGVSVAIIDTGFAPHPYFDQHGYNITRLASSDTSSPEKDDEPHGTAVLAALLACAPDVEAIGIKGGDNIVLAFDLAMSCPRLRAVSLSWVYDLLGKKDLPDELVPLWIRILDVISAGLTVVAAAGNGQTSFPAMMPDVIAVGGVSIDAKNDTLEAWSGASSFSSSIFAHRNVPDVCALASDMWLPIPGTPPDWMSSHGTSFAAPQICGIAALLLQKNPALTPNDLRTALTSTAVDITAGTTASGDTALPGNDRATGAGLVSALEAWQLL